VAEGTLVTFYSYKGGVGRSFALANVAVVLSTWGYRVLCIDWDLEAPGLRHYFKTQPHRGLVELVRSLRSVSAPAPTGMWRDYVTIVEPVPGQRLDLILAGFQDGEYIGRMQDLRWDELYEQYGLAEALEAWRREWKEEYDFVLIDSRTGITDIGAICTAHLPDVLVVLFTANHQSIDGCVEVIDRAAAARKKLPFDRSALHVVPVPARFDAKEEYQRAQEWRAIFVAKTGRFLSSWIEQGVDAGEVINRATIPYVAYWSFGEDLPVIHEARSPDSIRFSLETLAALVAHRLGNSRLLVETAESYVHAAIRAGHRIGGYASDIFLSATADFDAKARELAETLRQREFSVYVAEHRSSTSSSGTEEPDRGLDQAQHAVFLIGREFSSQLDMELRRFAKQLIDEQTDRLVLPITFHREAAHALPSFLQRSRIEANPEMTVEALANLIAREVRPAGKKPAAAAENRPDVRLAESNLNAASALARKAAVSTLGRVGNRATLDTLAQRLDDADQRVREEAKRAIASILKREQAASPTSAVDLQQLLASSSANVRILAAEIQAGAGDAQAVYVLLALLADADASVRKRAIDALGTIGHAAAIDWLMVHTEDPEPEVRGAVLGALIRIGGVETSEILEVIARADNYYSLEFSAALVAGIPELSNLNPLIDHVREFGVQAVIRNMLGGADRVRVEGWLLRALETSPPQAVEEVANLLAGNSNAQVVDVLCARSADQSPEIRAASTAALGRFRGAEVIRALIPRVSDKEPSVRFSAVTSLGQLGSPLSLEALTAASDDESPQVRAAAVNALGRLGLADAVKALIPRLVDRESSVRGAAAMALASIGTPESIEALIAAHADTALEVRVAAVKALGRIGNPDNLPVLTARLSDAAATVRTAAATALGEITDPRSVQALLLALDDVDPSVRTAALSSIAKLSQFDRDDQLLLTRDLDGVDPWLDPRSPIGNDHIELASEKMGISKAQVMTRLLDIQARLGNRLTLASRRPVTSAAGGEPRDGGEIPSRDKPPGVKKTRRSKK